MMDSATRLDNGSLVREIANLSAELNDYCAFNPEMTMEGVTRREARLAALRDMLEHEYA